MGERFNVYEGTAPYIMVSYARKDKERVFPLLDALHEKGYRIWLDEGGIPWGEEWMELIDDHIGRSEICLVFWSKASSDSQHCRAETGEIVAEKKKIVTVFLDDTPVRKGLRMYLRQFQAVKLADFESYAAFVERLEEEDVFAPCKTQTNQWNKDGLIQWYLDGDGVLTIAKNEDLRDLRTVPMPDYSWSQSEPWYGEIIRSVVIQNNIDTIGACAFCGYSSLTSVAIPDSVTHIAEKAFANCAHLMRVELPWDSWCKVGEYASFPSHTKVVYREPWRK